MNNSRCERNTRELLSIKRGETESLRDLIGPFNMKTITDPPLQQDLVILALMTRLKEGFTFRSYLGRNTFTSPGLGLLIERVDREQDPARLDSKTRKPCLTQLENSLSFLSHCSSRAR